MLGHPVWVAWRIEVYQPAPARRPQVLTASMTGKDQIAALHTTVIKERPVGLEPHMATQGLNEAEDGEDQGQYDGATDKAGKRSGQGK